MFKVGQDSGTNSCKRLRFKTDVSTIFADHFAVIISTTLHLEFVDLMVLFVF